MVSPHERVITIKTGTILKVIGVFLVLGFIWMIRDILLLVVAALFLAALMHPAARWGERRRIPKGVMVILIYFALFGLLALSMTLILPTLIQQVSSISPSLGSSISGTVIQFLNSLKEFTQQYDISKSFSSVGVGSFSQVSQTASQLFGALSNVFGGLAGFAVVLVIAFYMVVQEKDAVRIFRDIVPESYQEKSAGILKQVEEKIGKWLSGQLILSLIIGVFYYIGLLILGIDSPLALAIFASFTEFIPYLGPILGGIPIVLMAFGESPVKALFAMGLVVVIQQLENQIIVPKVMERAVGLNPLISIIAVLVGAKLFGVVGALLAIPVATSLSVMLSELYRYRQEQNSL